MKPISHSHSAPAQGALEYLLLIGGAVLVATIILVIALGGIFPNAKGIINTNLDQFQHAINLGAVNNGGGEGEVVITTRYVNLPEKRLRLVQAIVRHQFVIITWCAI